MKQLPMSVLGDHAFLVEDYKQAFEYYQKAVNQVQSDSSFSDELLLYKLKFELTVISTILGKKEESESIFIQLESFLRDVEANRRNIQDKTDMSVEELGFSILKESTKEEVFDIDLFDRLMKEKFPHKNDILSLLFYPKFDRSSLRAEIRKAEKIQIIPVLEQGMFRFTIQPQMYVVLGRAYSTVELELENIKKIEELRIFSENSDSYYVEHEKLRIVASIQREGLIICYYLPQGLRDDKIILNISTFLKILSDALYREK